MKGAILRRCEVKRKLLALVALAALSACGFSAYEAYLLSGRQTHVMLFSVAKADRENEARTALKALASPQAAGVFGQAKISNLSAYAKVLRGKPCFMVYFDYDGTNYLEAVKAFESVPQVTKLKPLVQPHPRAAQQGTGWLQMEWINFICGAGPGENPKRFAMVTRLKPEKESEYRLLHQSTWPGVVDRMTRMAYHNFSIFLVELDDEIYEMFYCEFVGKDADKDQMGSRADPTYERWVKVTDTCQNPLPDADGVWSAMEKCE